MKQARAFGVGVLIATQNPMDLDYRALSNAGLWCLGRLQTDADRERVIDGLALEDPSFANTLQRLAPRWFVMRDAHTSSTPVLLHPRQTMTLMRGPMTRSEIRKAREAGTNASVTPTPPRVTPSREASSTTRVTPSEARGPLGALESAE